MPAKTTTYTPINTNFRLFRIDSKGRESEVGFYQGNDFINILSAVREISVTVSGVDGKAFGTASGYFIGFPQINAGDRYFISITNSATCQVNNFDLRHNSLAITFSSNKKEIGKMHISF